MAKIEFILEDQSPDLRSNEVALKFSIINGGLSPIEIHSIKPRIPRDVEIIEVKEPSFEATQLDRNNLCAELTELLNYSISLSSSQIKKRRDELSKDDSSDPIPGSLFGILDLFYVTVAMLKSIRSILSHKDVVLSAYFEKIDNSNQAKSALAKWLTTPNTEQDHIKLLFESKVEKLEAIEEKITKSGSTLVAVIEPESFLAVTYVLRFKRARYDPRKYTIAIESEYSEPVNGSQKILASASKVIVISPMPSSLSYIAFSSAILGTFVKIVLEGGSSFVAKIEVGNSVIDNILTYIIQAIAASIVGVIFFNIYEFTEAGKKIELSISWRSALLIGFLSGMLLDKLLASIKAFIG